VDFSVLMALLLAKLTPIARKLLACAMMKTRVNIINAVFYFIQQETLSHTLACKSVKCR
jgi:hypothetical protein